MKFIKSHLLNQGLPAPSPSPPPDSFQQDSYVGREKISVLARDTKKNCKED